ncbi:MAG: ubiquinone biosynthesis protein UbiJ [Parasphingorhabdus sp.]|jgi:ubiquinone biosynthesis protein UbiJ
MIVKQIERVMNSALGTDPDSQQRLQQLNGKTLAIQLESLTSHSFILSFQQAEIQLESVSEISDCDATIIGGPFGFLRGMGQPADRRIFSDGGLQVEGDIHVVQQCADLVAAFEPDWQERLSTVIGDVATYRLETVIKAIQSWLAEFRSKAVVDSADYLREEVRILAPGPRVGVFVDNIDELVASVDRLEAKIDRLENKLDLP